MARFNLVPDPPPADNSIKAFFAIRRRSAGDPFRLVARWLLGKQSDLPRETDTFEVRFRLQNKGWYLKPDGTFDQTGADAFITVRPKSQFMLDPARVDVPIDATGNPPMVWQVAQKPTEGVDCSLQITGQMPSGKPFGVCHLLREVQPSRVELRAFRMLEDHVPAAMAAMAPRAQQFSMFNSSQSPERRLARHLARLIVRGGVRPLHLPRVMLSHYRELAQMERDQKAGLDNVTRPKANMFLNAEPDFHRWEFAAAATRVLSDKNLVQALDDTVTPAQSVREQLRLRALHGGNLINYWCMDGVGNCADLDRGQQVPAAEALGLGLTIGSFSEADLQSWQGDTLVLTVKQSPPAHGFTEIAFDEPVSDEAMHLFADLDQTYTDGTFPFDLTAIAVARTMQRNSSIAPPAPLKASINYDLMQSNPGSSDEDLAKIGKAFDFRTGDGRLEIVITPPIFDPLAGKTVYGYNVYGMWESAATQAYFNDPNAVPPPNERSRWLITRRYSYERDLQKAFPDVNHTQHPGLTLALQSPPQEAHLERAEKYIDEHDPNKRQELPNVANSQDSGGNLVRLTEWNFDLRTAMRMADETGRTFDDWDPKGRVYTKWRPELKRDGTAVGAAAQRYRFWVTSVDCFEQESDLLAVHTEDVDAGQAGPSYYFQPLHRTPLLPPAAESENNGVKSGRYLDYSNGRLSVLWDTPHLNNTGSRSEDDVMAEKTDLVCYVAILRRLLRRKVDNSVNFLPPAHSMGLDLPNPRWAQALNVIMTADPSWEIFVPPTSVSAPGGAGQQWSFSEMLAHPDTGYEYMAAISASVRPGRQIFWTPPALQTSAADSGRRVQVTMTYKDGSPPTLAYSRISERPAESEVVTTKALPVPNCAEPRGVELLPPSTSASGRWLAAPILPPPSVDRDLVLLRLLTFSFTGDPAQLPVWRDTGVALTSGQVSMIETAFSRTFSPSSTPIPDADLRDARWLFAAEFQNSAISTSPFYRQHATIGFRGLQQLKWRYRPSSANNPLKVDEAETVRFKIYGIRVPAVDPAAATRYATFVFDVHLVSGSTYRSAGNAPAAISVLTDNRQPAFARLVDVNGAVVYGVVSTAVMTGNQVDIGVDDLEGTPASAQLTLYLYVAQPLLDLPVTTWANDSEYRTYLPVGGGPEEYFCWWIAPVSAQEVEVGPHPARRPHIKFRFLRSIQPETPQFFQVSGPFDGTHHLLNPTDPNDKKWLPSEVSTPKVAIAKPRLVLTWGPLTETGVKITIERDERQVSKPDSALARLTAPTAWESIKAIESAPDGKPLDSAWLNAIQNNWLLGKRVDITSDDLPVNSSTFFLPPQKDLAGNGIRPFPSMTETGVANRPGFIDYFLHSGDPVHATDGNWEYQYRLSAFVDLGADMPDPNWRYLLSHPTSRSPWALPGTSPIALQVQQDTPEQRNDLAAPTVVFRFDIPSGTQNGDLRYRVVIRRQLNFTLRSTPESIMEPKFLIIGQPLELPVANGDSPTITDLQLDRDGPDLPLDLQYEISVKEFVVVDGRDKLIRHQTAQISGNDPGKLTIPPPQNPQVEVKFTRAIRIDPT